MDDDDIRALIAEALRRRPEAVRRLVAILRPEVAAEVGHMLARVAPAHGRSSTQERDDLVQQVFVTLWERDGELLRRWDPTRGRSLASYVRLVTRSRVLDILRSPTRNPWQMQPLVDDDEDPESGAPAQQAAILAAREQLAQVQGMLAQKFEVRDWLLFYGLLVEERTPKDVADELDMTIAAVYQWKSRFGRGTLQEIAAALAKNGGGGGPPAAPNGTGARDPVPSGGGPAAPPAQPLGTIVGVREDAIDP